jgi:hypothetical protein
MGSHALSRHEAAIATPEGTRVSRVEPPSARLESQVSNPAGARRWKKFGVAFALLLVPMLLWALASPLGSVPDEPSHAIRAAAVVRGQIVTPPWSGNPRLAQSVVPRYVANMVDLTCYAGKPRVTPACEIPLSGNTDVLVTTGNSASSNSPAFYAILGLPTLVLDGDAALYAMRFLNSTLCALAMAAMFMQLTLLARSRWAIVGGVIAVTPMVFFLSGSINPNAIEVASAGALFVTLVGIVRSPSSVRILWERIAISVISVGLLVNSRSISLLWIILIIGAVLALANGERLRALLSGAGAWVLLISSAALVVAALTWYANPPRYEGGPVVGDVTSSLAAFISMAVRTFEFASGYVGYFGWLDTPSPALSIILWSFFIVGMIVGALIWGSGRARWVAAGFGGAMLAVPPVVQAFVAPELGYIWQGRYMLAMLICLLVACGMALDNTFEEHQMAPRSRTTVATVLSLFALGQVLSFVWTLRRYTVGSHGSIVAMITNPTWQPPGGWITLTTILAGWGVGLVFVLRRQVCGVQR